MLPRFVLGLYLAVAFFLIVAAITMRIFHVTTTHVLLRHIGASLAWPLLLFSISGRLLLLSIIKDTQQGKEA